MVAGKPVEVGVGSQVEGSKKKDNKVDSKSRPGQLVVGLVGGLKSSQQEESENPKGVDCQNEHCGSQPIAHTYESF